MPSILGYLDALLRPRTSLLTINGARVDVLIVTGFNGELFIGETTAQRIGVVLLPNWRNVTVAGGGPSVRIQEGEIDVHWISPAAPRRTNVFVYSPEPASRRGEPEGLLGMRLISPDKLFIDCLNGDVRITA